MSLSLSLARSLSLFHYNKFIIRLHHPANIIRTILDEIRNSEKALWGIRS